MQARRSVLIVDDQLGDLRWLVDLVRNRGHEVVVAANEQAARERLLAVKGGKESYVMAIVDVMIATRDLRDLVALDDQFFEDSRNTGIRLCRYARHELGLSDAELPIVCLTVRHDDQVKGAMSELGIPLYDRGEPSPDESIRALIERRLGPRQFVADAGAESLRPSGGPRHEAR